MIEPSDRVNHPAHYQWMKEAIGVEPIEICRLFDYDLGSALKYIFRSGHKTEQGYSITEKEVEDLEKAIVYIKDEIKMIKQRQSNESKD